MRLRSSLLGGLALFALAAPAQARTDEDEQVWINATIMGNPKDDRGFAWFMEVQPRFGDGASELQQVLIRPAIGWKLSPKLTVYAGYAHVPSPAANRNEDRFFGQVSWTVGKIGTGTLSSRTRLEYRDLSKGRDEGWRVREMLRFVHPLGDPKHTRLLVSTEPFWNLNDTDWGARAGFDQVRNFGGVEIPIGGKSTIELGYLNQLINDPGGNYRMNHVASLAVFFRL